MLQYTFLLLKYCGLWQPINWHPGWKTSLYTVYTYSIIFIIYTNTLTELIDLVTSTSDIEEVASNSFMLLSMIGVCGKAVTVVIRRRLIVDLKTLLERDPCRPRNNAEVQIQNKFDHLVK